MSSPPQQPSEKPSGYINVAATVSPVFTCCLSAVTNRNIANNTPRSAKRFSFEQEEPRESSVSEIEVTEDEASVVRL